MILKNKNILIGVSGSIAAYKIATLVRLLVKEQANVKVIMTDAAKTFITPLTLSTLSKNPVLSNFTADETGQWNNHVELGLWADVMLIAPASANTLAKCAHGICDSLLVATYFSARCQVFFAPAMDLDMYQHFSTKNNLQILSENGNTIIEPNEGELASGLEGKGRMAEPEELVYFLEAHFAKIDALKGKKVLISAGPTQEDIDPVRYISNHSSGKMGYEIAKSFALAGAEVILVSGPSGVAKPHGVHLEKVRSAQEMFDAMVLHHAAADFVIFSAAVADYKPKEVADKKLKKNDAELFIALERTQDIAGYLGKNKKQNQVHVGFALETNDELENAKGKLERKNFDMIVLNSLQDKGAGFRYDTNKITIIDKKGSSQSYDLKSKEMVAEDIKNAILAYIYQSTI
ncbi:bifunctional phosphopantothenoylcysteine decarboxylase/phosphopantothenate--cysteine ligase CoaBC [Lacihabitans sp. LS3-19]|uniref:bifunctional phosphopantothenoylcysteine decarboxylase/phosphopantothenate--cysteine ligase CoaBC n=1 Tax=Lacihabitans sp. LS3-19 TaxID=2487335 RepID=UPI0020CD2926|nr:bifunctional phosphopantothenoylcysteine decarboxylase/phosphopantothenate--cysteine ligase CoaBC [Lacihabitans sp. LS3-19]MCP9767415.1 bifunctional phosphopantothenoylcysteine decarboxylase/phosphopantothenate--cysteine ligase CoaBC [Lacihabitans sp. LS3-19]